MAQRMQFIRASWIGPIRIWIWEPVLRVRDKILFGTYVSGVQCSEVSFTLQDETAMPLILFDINSFNSKKRCKNMALTKMAMKHNVKGIICLQFLNMIFFSCRCRHRRFWKLKKSQFQTKLSPNKIFISSFLLTNPSSGKIKCSVARFGTRFGHIVTKSSRICMNFLPSKSSGIIHRYYLVPLALSVHEQK